MTLKVQQNNLWEQNQYALIMYENISTLYQYPSCNVVCYEYMMYVTFVLLLPPRNYFTYWTSLPCPDL